MRRLPKRWGAERKDQARALGRPQATAQGSATWTCNSFVPVAYLITPPWPRMRAGYCRPDMSDVCGLPACEAWRPRRIASQKAANIDRLCTAHAQVKNLACSKVIVANDARKLGHGGHLPILSPWSIMVLVRPLALSLLVRHEEQNIRGS